MTMQANSYDLMKENGWYQVNNIDTNTIYETLTKLENGN